MPSRRSTSDPAFQRGADALDLPFERSPARLEDPAPDLFAKRFEIGGGRGPKIDQKVTMHGRHLGAPKTQAPTPCLVDQFPCLQPWRILERRAAGLLADRLRGFARASDPLHLGFDRLGLAGAALKYGAGEHDVIRRQAMAVRKSHLR